jgi:hypothetical protein
MPTHPVQDEREEEPQRVSFEEALDEVLREDAEIIAELTKR